MPANLASDMTKGKWFRTKEFKEKLSLAQKRAGNNSGRFQKGFKPWKTGKGKQCWCKECHKKYTKFYNMTYNIRNKKSLNEKVRTNLRARFNNAHNTAKHKNKEWSISYDDFLIIVAKSCVYCGENIEIRGMDRINNNLGYTLENIASCCSLCNYLKRDLSVEEFKNHIRKIYIHLKI